MAEALTILDPKPDDIVVTIATLTGVVGYAVGEKCTGIFSDNDKLIHIYMKASKKAKELAWHLPMFGYLQKNFDKKPIRNSFKVNPGASMVAMFIKQFVRYPENWLHLDIGASAFDEK